MQVFVHSLIDILAENATQQLYLEAPIYRTEKLLSSLLSWQNHQIFRQQTHACPVKPEYFV